MISVIEVYNTLRDLANKDQKGFVTPKTFNTFAEIAQETVYREMFQELADVKALRLRNADPARGESLYRGKQDDLHFYITESVLSSSRDPNISGDSNLFKFPANFTKFISLRVVDETRTPIEAIYNPEKISHILSSNLSAPTESYPVALMSKNVEVFPQDISSVVMTYYRQPSSRYATTIKRVGDIGDIDESSSPRIAMLSNTELDDGFFAINPIESRNFDLPEHYKTELIAEMAKMIGVRLRDPILSQYGTAETQDK